MSKVLGIDVGGTGIKAGIVDTKKVKLLTERKRILTPQPPTPKAIAKVVKQMVDLFDWEGKPVSIGFPALIKNGICLTANNIDQKWIGTDMVALFKKYIGVEVTLVNDADAAGIAEWSLYKEKGKTKTMVLITLGTGVGSCIVANNQFIPNTELGSLLFKKGTVEDYIANSARVNKKLSYKEWAKLLNVFLMNMERVFSPDVIILGGGVCKKFDKYEKYLTTNCEVKPAVMKNAAGVIGAAMATEM